MLVRLIKSIFSDKKFYRTLLVLALPIVVQNLIASSLNMMDTVMLGSLADTSIAEDSVAAAGIANQFFFFFNLIVNGAAAGCSVFISQYWGCRDRENIRRVMGFGLLANTALGLLFTLPALLMPHLIIRIFSPFDNIVSLGADYLQLVCVSYVFTGITLLLSNALRSVEKTVLPMIVNILAVGINIFLNWVFIFGNLGAPAMEIRGAALATVIARMIECVLLLIISFHPRSVLASKWRELLSISRAFVAKVIRQIIPVLLNEGCWALGSMLYVAAYGHINSYASASFQVYTTIQNMFMAVCFGLASAALVMTGNQLGAGRKDNALTYSRRFTFWGLIIGILLGGTVILSAPRLLTFFNLSPQAVETAIAMLRIFGLIAPIRVLNVVLIVGVFRGGGDAGFALAAEGFTMWCIGVPAAFLGAFVFHMTVEQVVLLVTLEEVAKCIICILRLRSNKWIHSVTEEALPAKGAGEH